MTIFSSTFFMFIKFDDYLFCAEHYWPNETPFSSSGERCTVTRPTLKAKHYLWIFMVYHYVWLDDLKQRITLRYFSFRTVRKAAARQNLCLLSVYLAVQCSKAEELVLIEYFMLQSFEYCSPLRSAGFPISFKKDDSFPVLFSSVISCFSVSDAS